MNDLPPPRIPIPLGQHWRDARMRLLPILVLAGALGMVGYLWKNNVAAPTLVGQVEPVQANVSSYKPGTLAQLTVSRFQKVKAGDSVGQVLVTDPRILASTLAVIQAEIELLKINMEPIMTQQRTAMDYDKLRMDWMKRRADLAMARINLQLAEAELHRSEELFQEKIVSQRVLEQAQAARDRYQSEVTELNVLVTEQQQNFSFLQPTNVVEIARVSHDPMHAAILVQESKLRLAEAELSPITLIAPVDGTVSSIYHRSGETILAGDPILGISGGSSARIIGYLRQPTIVEPKLGMAVQVRTRGIYRESAAAKIIEFGTQFESISPALLSAAKPANLELGLPIAVSIPPHLKVRPGELVDLILQPAD
ncbi:MAG: hypothetical protein ABIQ35_08925 [Verrucomicrobiota bacterium]